MNCKNTAPNNFNLLVHNLNGTLVLPVSSRMAESEIEAGIILNVLNNIDELNSDANTSSSTGTGTGRQSESSLAIVCGDYETNENLINVLQKNLRYFAFSKWGACYWPASGESNETALKTWFIFARVVLVICSIEAIYLIIIFNIQPDNGNVLIFFWIATFFDFVSVIPGQYLNQLRLQERARMFDSTVIDESMNIVTYFTITSIIFILFGIVTFAIALQNYPFFWILPNLIYLSLQVFMVMYLAFNLFFLIMDLGVSSLLLDQLDVLVDAQTLTLQRFNAVKADIRRRDRDSKWATDLVVVPCAASVICIVVVLYDLSTDTGPYTYWSKTSLILLLLKHMIYVAIAFWYVAKVNGKADALTVKLSQQVWCPAESYVPDMQRLSIYASSAAEPIGYTLLFKRLNWQNLAVSAFGLSTTVLVICIKAIIGV